MSVDDIEAWQQRNPRAAALVDWLLLVVARCGEVTWIAVFCRLFGAHTWVYEPYLRVPGYGIGHRRCFACRVVKVKP